MSQVIAVPGPLSGKNYRVQIAGDEPTVDEQQRIDAFIRQREAEFAQEYEERFGERLSDEGEGVLNYLGEIPKGLLSGAAGLLESGALGAATLLPEGAELPTRELIRSIGYGAQRRLTPDVGLEESVARRLSEGVGSLAACLLRQRSTLRPRLVWPLGLGPGKQANAHVQKMPLPKSAHRPPDSARLWEPLNLSRSASLKCSAVTRSVAL